MLLPLVAQSYGARTELNPHVLKDCIDLVFRKFSFLGLHEIKEAYRQYSCGDFKSSAGAMYGGEFNAANLGAVLSGYNRHRKKIIAAYLSEKDEKTRLEEKERKVKDQQERFELEFPIILKKARHRYFSADKLPLRWYEMAVRRDMINFEKGEKLKIYNDSKRLAFIHACKSFGTGCLAINNIEKVTKTTDTIHLDFAKRLTVWDKLTEA